MIYRRKRQKKNNVAVPVFIIAIMVLSVLGYSLLQGRDSNVRKYGEWKFVNVADKYWRATSNDIETVFYFTPEEVADIPCESIAAFPYFVYLTSNPNASYSQQELMTIDLAKFELKNTLLFLGYEPQMAFSNAITCANSTSTTGVVDIDISNETAVKVYGSCVKIEGLNSIEVVRARDKFLMLILGILE
jgi:hypothetical protein